MISVKDAVIAYLSTKKESDPSKNNTVRGGNSGFMVDGVVWASSTQSCLRMILLRSRGIEDVKNLTSLLTFEVGFMWERIAEAALKKTYGDANVSTQLELTYDISGSSIKGFSHVDFTVKYNDELYVVDTKSISSINSYVDSFVKHEAKTDYIAQLMGYADILKARFALLSSASFVYGSSGFKGKPGYIKIEPSIKDSYLRLDPDGRIFIDGNRFVYTVKELRAHRQQAALTIESGTVYESRPKATKWNPCTFCPVAPLCDHHDKFKLSDGEFITRAKALLQPSDK